MDRCLEISAVQMDEAPQDQVPQDKAHQDEIDLRHSLTMARVGLLTVPQSNSNGEDDLTSSRPPSPPESGTTTPRVTIAPCPSRLTPLFPPPNYTCVDEDKVYRSSYPQDRHVEFIDSIGVSSILTLVDTQPTVGYQTWLDKVKPRHAVIQIGKNKDPDGRIDAEFRPIYDALLFIMNGCNHPVFVHCNQGKHRTGCVIGCLRRIQGDMTLSEIIDEYRTHAEEKARPGDIALIESFDPNLMFKYALSEGIVDSLLRSRNEANSLWRRDSRLITEPITNIHALRAALDSGLMGEMDWSSDASTASSSNEPVTPSPLNEAGSPNVRVMEERKIVGFNMTTSAVIREGDVVDEGAATDDVVMAD